ncbi:hypothetical protein JAAARDRAFT_29446 [Jaapia argillacea MUCL 33604]|uniref:Uncharacterized protein n=1 Tax=Jaapia argillacea MUCL 33604 TaxID=933084 RepID=A0A067QBB6_9AGAM|nr:hypothetical protein JAAARDRAFT_29446 [Jaapia argillacea MUCL 33604]
MAAPETMTTLDMSGKFTLNRSLSDSTDEILKLQGVGWMKRKAIGLATINLAVKHYTDDSGIEHIDITQTLGSLPGNQEDRILDWTARNKVDGTFGAVIGKTKRAKVEEVEDDSGFLKEGWTEDVIEKGLILVYGAGDTEKGAPAWIAEQTWGFEVVGKVRRYVRHLKFKGPGGEDIKARMVYDYTGSLEELKK